MKNKKEVIKALKENKKLILIIGVIFVSGIIIGVSVSTIYFNSGSKSYIAIDDTFKGLLSDEINGNKDYVTHGGCGYHGLFRFNLDDKPKQWKKVEISLYIYRWEDGGSTIVLFESNWTETMTNRDLGTCMTNYACYWIVNLRYILWLNGTIGIQRVDITDYIKDNTSISISLHDHVENRDGTVWIHSKEAEVNKAYLPQLIWS